MTASAQGGVVSEPKTYMYEWISKSQKKHLTLVGEVFLAVYASKKVLQSHAVLQRTRIIQLSYAGYLFTDHVHSWRLDVRILQWK